MPDAASMRTNEFGAVWCEDHRRWEPAHLTKYGKRCHQLVISGTNQCRMHPGQLIADVKAKGQANLVRQRFRDVSPSEYVDPGDVLLWAVTLASIDLADYRAELRDRGEGNQAGDAELDRLARLIDQAARMAKQALDAKIDERRVSMHEALGDRLTAFVRSLLVALGHDPLDPVVASVARQQLELMAGVA